MQNNALEPGIIAWAFLPGGAATGAIPLQAFGCVCNHSANAGQWECSLNDAVSLTNGDAILLQGIGTPGDNNDGVYFTIGDNGVGAFELTVRKRSDNTPDNTQPVSFIVWRMPKQH